MEALKLALFVAAMIVDMYPVDKLRRHFANATENPEDLKNTEYSVDGGRQIKSSNGESVVDALRTVAQVEEQLRANKGCNKVDLLNITFDDRRWKKEALLTVQVANFMTSLWRSHGNGGYSDAFPDTLLYHFVRSIVLFSPSVFGSVICFDNNLYKNYSRFCPYAFRDADRNGSVHVFDIAASDYDYTTDTNAIWWIQPKKKANSFTPSKRTDYYAVRFNATTADKLEQRVVPYITFENGTWTRPYFDCFGGKVWMVTYLAPFYNETDEFLGVVSIDIVLSDIDINQCDDQASSTSGGRVENEDDALFGSNLIEFMGTHLCKPSTKCETIHNEGFKRGSYQCACREGYYFPDGHVHASHQETHKAFNGNYIELQHDRMLRGEPNSYEHDFECIRCSRGCDRCVDDKPCMYGLKIIARLPLVVLTGLLMAVTLGFAVYLTRHWKDKIFKASSPKFMEVVLLGAMLMYISLIVSYFPPTNLRCVIKPWLQHVGFALVYGPLALKTWRVAMIFRVRSAQKLALSDNVLLRRLFLLVLLYAGYLTFWTVIHPSKVEMGLTSDGLKYGRCVENWYDLTIIFGDIVVLIWGMWLCYKIRNAPPAYNESKYISWAIYNAMFVTSFLMVVRVTTKSSSNPDMMYGLDFVMIHMNCTTVLILMFIHKFLLVRQMKRTVDNASSHNNMLAADEEIDVVRTTQLQEEKLEKENRRLKDEVRRLADKLAKLQSRLMTDENHHIQNSPSPNAGNIRRKSAFTIPTGSVTNIKRHSLQLLPPLLGDCPARRPPDMSWTVTNLDLITDCKKESEIFPQKPTVSRVSAYNIDQPTTHL